MSEHFAHIQWQRQEDAFIDRKYSREHIWKFDGGGEILASASPHVVPEPYANPAHVDPEEAFIAAIASCHMLWFLAIAAKHRFVVDRYLDQAVGILEKNEVGNLAITKIYLNPQVIFAGDHLPTEQQIEEMHDLAHHSCFLANSVKAEIIVAAIVPSTAD
ncbi:OsmC family protein [Trichothermofontia sp.]